MRCASSSSFYQKIKSEIILDEQLISVCLQVKNETAVQPLDLCYQHTAVQTEADDSSSYCTECSLQVQLTRVKLYQHIPKTLTSPSKISNFRRQVHILNIKLKLDLHFPEDTAALAGKWIISKFEVIFGFYALVSCKWNAESELFLPLCAGINTWL